MNKFINATETFDEARPQLPGHPRLGDLPNHRDVVGRVPLLACMLHIDQKPGTFGVAEPRLSYCHAGVQSGPFFVKRLADRELQSET